VRERLAAPAAHQDHPGPVASLAHPSHRLVAQLNANWRVVDVPLQWILQRRKGNPRKKNSGWHSRCFCTTRGALLRYVREYCGDVDTTSLAKLAALSSDHATRVPPGTPAPRGAQDGLRAETSNRLDGASNRGSL
jgi:hypothetical protein